MDAHQLFAAVSRLTEKLFPRERRSHTTRARTQVNVSPDATPAAATPDTTEHPIVQSL
ncbi:MULTISPECIES: hypothetical protein [Rhodococcus]|uniref:hypothetical protein n=1 Tax=Rhodococcus TaxID=1827 RepID=UPI0002D766D2|nr:MULTISPECIES: hypothetical protein [Rhodococcus]AHK32514.1 hypothetical protein Pd630_LPD05309 [Rhodococcus opacus PD630]